MADETFVSSSFGTPLKPIDEDDKNAHIRPKPIAIHDQIATDDKGRRRFHGAFSGGFSAGYFNTVGSKDGWTPKNFKSTRSVQSQSANRNSGQTTFQQTAQDFMDEDDIAAFGIAPKKLQASSNFFQKTYAAKGHKASNESEDYFEKKNARLTQISDIFRGSEQNSALPLGQPVFEQIFVPVKETIGVRLLREMGWKPGQGIGPRVTRKSKKVLNRKTQILFQKSRSPTVQSSDDDENTDEFVSKYRQFLFAPDDVPAALSQQAKDNLFGIAYKGLDRTQIPSSGHFSLFSPAPSIPSKDKTSGQSKMQHNFSKPKPIVGQAFGVGVYEEEDEDIYAKDDVSSYDFFLEPSHSNDKDKSNKRATRWENSESNQYLPGFVPEETTSRLNNTIRFPPPQLPVNYRPHPVKKSRFEDNDEEKEKSTFNQQSNTTSRVPLIPNLETDNVSEKSSSDMENSKRDGHSGSNLSIAKSSEELRSLVEDIQNQHLAASLLSSNSTLISNFKPYASDPPKQKRYEQYILCLKNGRRDALPLLQPKDMTEWERNREQMEFDRAAILYHNSDNNSRDKSSGSSFMSSRFVSAKGNEELDVGKDLSSSKDNDTLSLTEAEKAAQLKCYGRLTREKVEWHPARLLCIRFNVKQPYGDSSLIGAPPGYKCRLDIFKSVGEATQDSQTAKITEKQKSDVNILEKSTVSSKSEPYENFGIAKDIPEESFKKASDDLFKAIFLDSDDSCDSDNETIKESGQDAEACTFPLNDQKIKELDPDQANKSNSCNIKEENNSLEIPSNDRTKILKQPKGLFANIDFSSFNKKKSLANVQLEKEKSVIGPSRKRPVAVDFIQEINDSSGKTSSDENDEFGPKKPKKSDLKCSVTKPDYAVELEKDESDEWMEETNEVSKEKTKSSAKKKKSKKSKHKKEKKKRSKNENRDHKRKSSDDRKTAKKSRKKHRRRLSSDESISSSST